MGHKETKMSMKIHALHNIKRWGWNWIYRDSDILNTYRCIFDIPDYIPKNQMKRWVIESTRDIYRFS